ncbi:KAP family P-loop NTPase fold protein [Micromonospora echinaurantiaca]|uniref:KAP family P-loop NTPase fold protein n=1 Tax=Micromonospora echinaurantiaca TaxID=47857 RepID=UPI003448CDAD
MPGVTDNPITEASQDLLDRRDVAAALADNLRYVDASMGYVVGVLGPWGSGKTSLLNLVRERLSSDPALPVLDFNPWMFSGAEQLVESFFTEVAAQLRLKGGRFERIADGLDSYSELLTPLGIIPVVGPWFERLRGAAGAIKKFQDKRKRGIGERRTQLSEELLKLEQPIVVVLDDIDRLTTSEIRAIFKLVRLTASFPNVIYLLAFDRRRVEKALSEEGIDGRDYLEKIVQTVVDIPSAPQDLLLRSLGQALDDVIESASRRQRFDADRWPDLLFEVIWPQIKNMRDVRRLAASVYAAIRELGDEVELGDVLAMEAVRLFMPDTYGTIQSSRDALTKPLSLGYSASRDNSRERAQVEAVVAAATEEAGADTAAAIIQRLFPAGSQHTSNIHYSSDSERLWLRKRRVAHRDVLQRYLERNASEDFSAFKDAERSLALAADEDRFGEYLSSIDPARLEKVIHSLEVYEGEIPLDAIVPMSVVLLNIMPIIPDRPRGMMDLMDGRLVVVRVVLRALRQLDSPQAIATAVDEIMPKLKHLSSRAELVRTVGRQEGAGSKLVAQETATAYEQDLARLIGESSPAELGQESDLLRLLLTAKRITGRSPLRPETITPQLTAAILRSAYSEVTSQFLDSRIVRRSYRLPWDILVSLYGNEDKLREAIDATRGLEDIPPGYADVLSLAGKYLSGWRPKDSDDDEE